MCFLFRQKRWQWPGRINSSRLLPVRSVRPRQTTKVRRRESSQRAHETKRVSRHQMPKSAAGHQSTHTPSNTTTDAAPDAGCVASLDAGAHHWRTNTAAYAKATHRRCRHTQSDSFPHTGANTSADARATTDAGAHTEPARDSRARMSSRQQTARVSVHE